MNPRDFQSLALELSTRNAPAHCRSSISRSYYSAFNVGAEILRSFGFAVGKGAAAHGEVVQCLSNCGNREIARVAYQLSDLHSARNRADYQLDRKDIEQPAMARRLRLKPAQ